ncbi:hypothetical protein GCM10009727_70160 [Actinomadura napierensis]|uniref:Uncharacterized protein n=1 Tax=Actinomadura napierensis TaxID=267854 RepID=A0ABN3AC88_9ACTN
MRHLDGLRPAGRAGRVDHVRELPAVGRQRGRGAGPAADRRVADRDRQGAPGGEVLQRRGVAEQQLDAAVGQHVPEPFDGQPGVQRKVGGARLPHGQERDHQVRAGPQAEPDHGLGPGARRAQVMGEAVGARVQVGVGQDGAARLHGDGVRAVRGVPGDQLVHAPGRGQLARGAVPVHGEAAAFGGVRPEQLGQVARGFAGGRVQQRGEPVGHPPDGRLVEQGRAELQYSGQVRRVLLHDQAQVELGGHRRQSEIGPRQIRARLRARAARGEVEDDLEQRMPGPVAGHRQGVHELLERQVLVGVRADGVRLDAAEQLGEGRVAGQVGPQDERVEEQADQALGLGPVAVGDRCAHQDVVLAGVAPEQRGERAEERHEQGRAGLAGQRAQPVGRLRRDPEPDGGAVRLVHGRARAVGRQVEGRGVREPVLPVGELLVEHVAAQPVPLPYGEVGVLHGQRRQWRRLAAAERPVQHGELSPEDVRRPFVARDVMQHKAQHVLAVGDPDQPGAQRRARGEVERRPRVLGEQRFGGLPGVGLPAEVGAGDVRAVRRDDHLVRRAVVARDQPGAQHLVPGHERVQRSGQRAGVQAGAEPDRDRHVVLGALRVEPLQEPQPLLGERQRQRPAPVHRHERRRRALVVAVRHPGQIGHGGALEERRQRHLDAEDAPDPRDQPGRQQGVAAQLEEAVRHADAVEAEQFRPDSGEDLLGRGAGRDVFPGGGRTAGGGVHRGQRGAVDLATGGEGQRGQLDDDRRDQMLGEGTAEQVTQLAEVREPLPRVRGHRIGHQVPAVPFTAGDHHGRRHGGMRPERGLDLTRLDAEAAHLDLLVHPAQELQPPVPAPPHPVAGPVEARPVRGERVAHEPFGGQGRAVGVAARHARPAHVQLARHAGRHRPQRAVQHVHPHAADGGADRRRSRSIGFAAGHGRADGGLGRAVGVEEPAAGRPAGGGVRAQLLARGDERRQAAEAAGIERAEQRRRDRRRRHPAPLDQRGQQRGIGTFGGGRHDQCRSGRPGHQDFPDRGVEAERGELQQRVTGPRAEGLPLGGGEVDRAPVGDLDALRAPGRARGVDQVGEPVRMRGHGERSGGHGVDQRRRDRVVQRHRAGPAHGQVVDERRVPDQHRGPAVGHHEAEPVSRVAGVERQVRAARLEHGEQGDDHVDAARQAQSHDDLGPDADVVQVPRQAAGALLQFGVGERLLSADHRGLGGMQPGLLGHQFVHAAHLGRRKRGRVPVVDDRASLAGGEQRQFRQPPVGCRRHRRQNGGQVACHRARGGLVEQVGRVLDLTAEQVAVAAERHGQVELGDRPVHGARVDREPVRPRRGRVPPVDAEHDLEERVAGSVAVGLEGVDELLEREVLVDVGLQRASAHPVQQFTERGVARQVGPHHQRVDEEPDQALGLGPVAARDRRTDHDVVLIGVPAEKHRERGQQRHEHRRAAVAGELQQALGDLGGQVEVDHRAPGRPDRRARPVGGQFQHRQPGEPIPPVPKLAFQHLATQPLALPHREIGVLHRQRRQRRRLTTGKRLVQSRELVPQHTRRPLIRHHMMHTQTQHMIIRSQHEQPSPQQRPHRQVERRLGVRGDQVVGDRLRVRLTREVDQRQIHRVRRVDHLVGHTVVVGDQARPQHLVAFDQFVERRAEGPDVQRSGEPQGQRGVVLR